MQCVSRCFHRRYKQRLKNLLWNADQAFTGVRLEICPAVRVGRIAAEGLEPLV